jgi:hypothetical protein
MYDYGNHTHVLSVEEHTTTSDCGVVVTFEQECMLGWNDQTPIVAKLEYVGWVEKILKLNYGMLNNIVLLCNWVKANYNGNNTKSNEMNMVSCL